MYVLEAFKGIDYSKLIEFIESKLPNTSRLCLTKENIKTLLTFVQSNRECEVIRNVVCQTANLSATAARKQCGWENQRCQPLNNFRSETSNTTGNVEQIQVQLQDFW